MRLPGAKAGATALHAPPAAQLLLVTFQEAAGAPWRDSVILYRKSSNCDQAALS